MNKNKINSKTTNKNKEIIQKILFTFVICGIFIIFSIFLYKIMAPKDTIKDTIEEESLDINDKKEDDLSFKEQIERRQLNVQEEYELSLKEQIERKKCNGNDCYFNSGREKILIPKCKSLNCKNKNNQCIYEKDNFTFGCPVYCIETECPEIFNKE